MNPAEFIRLAILVSLALLVFSLGLRAERGDAGYLLHRPRLLVKSLLAMNLLMPILTLWLVVLLDLRPAVKVALVALSVSPVPPFFPGKALKLIDRQGYVYGLLVASALFAVVLVPLSTAVLSWLALRGSAVGWGTVLRIVATTILVPLVLGIVARRWWPAGGATGDRARERVAQLCDIIAMLLLLAALILILVKQWPQMRSLLGDGTLFAAIAFTGIGLLVGHLVGGPDPQNRTVLALATASRHPAVAIAAASAVFPDETHAPAAVLLTLLVGVLAAVPYTSWRKKRSGPLRAEDRLQHQ